MASFTRASESWPVFTCRGCADDIGEFETSERPKLLTEPSFVRSTEMALNGFLPSIASEGGRLESPITLLRSSALPPAEGPEGAGVTAMELELEFEKELREPLREVVREPRRGVPLLQTLPMAQARPREVRWCREPEARREAEAEALLAMVAWLLRLFRTLAAEIGGRGLWTRKCSRSMAAAKPRRCSRSSTVTVSWPVNCRSPMPCSKTPCIQVMKSSKGTVSSMCASGSLAPCRTMCRSPEISCRESSRIPQPWKSTSNFASTSLLPSTSTRSSTRWSSRRSSTSRGPKSASSLTSCSRANCARRRSRSFSRRAAVTTMLKSSSERETPSCREAFSRPLALPASTACVTLANQRCCSSSRSASSSKSSSSTAAKSCETGNRAEVCAWRRKAAWMSTTSLSFQSTCGSSVSTRRTVPRT
mmetsp:Transcript_101085/g.306738  ORF Transcript_101085/g.306738 Transcript_101085/m.306738 type:complete len:420 (-) Transcript_101085:90-1349(-)